jgi:hypothetical protein
MSRLRVIPSSYEMSSRERKYITFDFADDMGAGVTITSATVRMVDRRNNAAVASGVLDGSPAINGTVVGQWVKEPPAGRYLLTIEAVMSDGSESDPELAILVPR